MLEGVLVALFGCPEPVERNIDGPGGSSYCRKGPTYKEIVETQDNEVSILHVLVVEDLTKFSHFEFSSRSKFKLRVLLDRGSLLLDEGCCEFFLLVICVRITFCRSRVVEFVEIFKCL